MAGSEAGDEVPIELARDLRQSQQGAGLRREGEAVRQLRPIERLYAQSVTCQPEPARHGIDDRQGEVTLQTLKGRREIPLSNQMGDQLKITCVSQAGLLLQLPAVQQTAVDGQQQPLVGAGTARRTGRKPGAMAQTPRLGADRRVAMAGEAGQHPFDGRGIPGSWLQEADKACKTGHDLIALVVR